MAILLPVLAVGVLAVIQVARVAGDQVALHHAVREAARQAALDPEQATIVRRATGATPELRADRLQVELGPQRGRGQLLRVRLVYRSPTDVPLVGRLVGDVELTATAVVRLE